VAVAFEVELLTGTYEAGIGGEQGEWPPHPARLFCALVAQAQQEDEWEALRWLEAQGPPEVLAPEANRSLLSAYVPTNRVARGASDLRRVGATYLARLSGRRLWPRALPSGRHFWFLWPDAQAPTEVLDALRRLCARIAYVGRPSGMVLVGVSDRLVDASDGLRRFVPTEGGEEILRVPYQGYVDALIAAFAAEGSAHEVGRAYPYSEPTPPGVPMPPVISGPYDALLTLGFPAGSGIAGWHAARVALAFRDAVLARLGREDYRQPDDPWDLFGEPELMPIHGHGTEIPPEARCAFLALPFVGSSRATGEIIGVGIAVGRDVDTRLRRALLQLAGLDWDDGPRLNSLRIPGVDVTFPLRPRDGRWTLEPDRWRRPSRRWASVLPVVLDRWPKRSSDVPQILREGVRRAGYPEPDAIELRRAPAVPGAPLLRTGDRKRRPADPDRPWAHVVVTFQEPVRGPVVLGHLRFAGLGLCSPEGIDG
jgi:CRISPR-associated protein Csb2